MYRENRITGLATAGALVLALGCATPVLAVLAAEEARRLWADRAGLAFDDLVLTAAVAVLAVAAAWLCLAMLLTLTAQLLRGSTGLTAALARRITPPLCRRLLLAACGAAVLTGPAVAPPAVALPAVALPAVALPPVEGTAASGAAPCRPAPRRAAPVKLPAPHRPVAVRARGRPHPVTVRAGDSLWAIAANHLPAPVSDADAAAAWPHWFRANRMRLGPDPNLIHPGTRLRVPPRFDRTRKDLR